MIPHFDASGHFFYANFCYLFVQHMSNLNKRISISVGEQNDILQSELCINSHKALFINLIVRIYI